MKYITIRLEDNLHEFLRKLSFETRKSINKLIVEQIIRLKSENQEESDTPGK